MTLRSYMSTRCRSTRSGKCRRQALYRPPSHESGLKARRAQSRTRPRRGRYKCAHVRSAPCDYCPVPTAGAPQDDDPLGHLYRASPRSVRICRGLLRQVTDDERTALRRAPVWGARRRRHPPRPDVAQHRLISCGDVRSAPDDDVLDRPTTCRYPASSTKPRSPMAPTRRRQRPKSSPQ